MTPMADYARDTHTTDGDCTHVWRVHGWTDRCVLCGDDRPHPPANPYTWDPYPPGGAA